MNSAIKNSLQLLALATQTIWMKQLFFLVFIGLCSSSLFGQKPDSSQGKLIFIETLDSISISRAKKIPSIVFDKSELKYLSVLGQDCCLSGVECFAISKIPNQIEKLTNLEELHLTLNYIQSLPIEILHLKKLRILDLTDNPSFKDIDTIVQMTWLEEFYCYGCHLSETDIESLKKGLPNCTLGIE